MALDRFATSVPGTVPHRTPSQSTERAFPSNPLTLFSLVTLLFSLTQVLQSSARDPLWHTRAATLNFTQAFCYRHLFALSPADAACIREVVLGLLEDPQLEVLALT